MRSALLFVLAVAGMVLLSANPSFAQATRTWVSGVGDDANPCSRTSPCKTFAGAISKTAAAGEINCIDPGGFGALTITKSIAIICDALEGGVLVSGTNAFVVSAATTDVVYISGLDFEGIGTGLSGIVINSAASVHVVNSVIRGFTTAAPNGNGILVQPSSGSTKLLVENSRIEGNGIGIEVRPTGSGSVVAAIRGTFANNNGAGMRGNGTTTTGTLAIAIMSSGASGNSGAGFNMTAGTATSALMMLNQAVSAGNNFGLRVDGATATARVGSSTFANNPSGDVSTTNGGTVLSYATNQVDDSSTPATTPLR